VEDIGGRVILKLSHSFIRCFGFNPIIRFLVHNLEIDCFLPHQITLSIEHSYIGVYGRFVRKYVIRKIVSIENRSFKSTQNLFQDTIFA
jgi:hypothetical protein